MTAPARVGAMRGWALVAAATAVGCGPGSLTLPEPPKAEETAALIAVYDTPTAVLDVDRAKEVATDAQARLPDLNLDWFPALVSDALARARRRLLDSGLPDDPGAPAEQSHPLLRAVVEGIRICPGGDDPASPPDGTVNGDVQLTAIVDVGRLQSELWGVATGCRLLQPAVAGSAVVVGPSDRPALKGSVDGTLIVSALAPLPDDPATGQFFVSFEGTIGVSGATRSVGFDFEYLAGTVKFRVPVPSGGDAIVTVGPTTFAIQGANAGFSCDLATLTCQ